MYYNSDKLFSYNCLFNFVISNRGGGKTYDFKKRGIKNFLKNKSQFIYIRRYKSELKKIKLFFNDIIRNNEFNGVNLEVKGNEFYCNGKICGYAMALSTALTQKSTSYPDVGLICYDEFIIDKGALHYLPNEVECFLEIYETIARSRENVKVEFIGNAISLVNPYFLYWNIIPDTTKRFNRYNQILIELFTDDDFIKMKTKTKFGQIINNTDYGDYAIYNKFVKDTDDFISKKSITSEFNCAVYYKNKYIGFWIDYKEGRIYSSYKYDPDTPFLYALTTSDFKINMLLARNIKRCFRLDMVKKAFEDGYLFYDDQHIKGIVYEIFSKFR